MHETKLWFVEPVVLDMHYLDYYTIALLTSFSSDGWDTRYAG
jgi:hypothetical protein